ncbi:Pentatricopeptide repeat-containing-like protein [Gossypium australe]|uniref:Pentatricopeptide repeat-containing-like protein n=1 Tax=Gossypium australe TaxID=47621 RepID=A0A5B6V1D7_9ROSI|nr:Pentatricopeptide repeat-containing-like protein [Gossypium australe]
MKVGVMSWKRFVDVKNNLFSKNYHGFSCKNKLPSNTTDLYINDIDWNLEINPNFFSEIKSISYDEEKEEKEVKKLDSFH